MLLPPLLRRRTELHAAAHAACGGGALSDAALETLCDWEVMRASCLTAYLLALSTHYLLCHLILILTQAVYYLLLGHAHR